MARSHHTPDAHTDYVTTVERALRRKLRHQDRVDVEDIVQNEMVTLLTKVDRIMVRYPDPTGYANVRAVHAVIQWTRSQKAGRGEGSHGGRRVVSGDAPIAGEKSADLFGTLVDPGTVDPADVTADTVDGTALLERCMIGMSVADRELLYLVDGCGLSVTEVAEMRGTSRETTSRHLSKARRQARLNAAAIMSTREVMAA